MRILSALLVAAALTVPELVGKAEVRASFLSPYSWRIEGVRDRAPAALAPTTAPTATSRTNPRSSGRTASAASGWYCRPFPRCAR